MLVRRELSLIIEAEKTRKIIAFGHAEAEGRNSVKKMVKDLSEEEPSEDTDGLYSLQLLTTFLASRSKESIIHRYSGAIDLDEEAGNLPPFPQIVVVQLDDSMQFYIAVEKQYCHWRVIVSKTASLI